MVRTAALYLLPAFLVATYWSRLETGAGGTGGLLWMVALALAPALVRPLWARLLVGLTAAGVAVEAAFDHSALEALPFRDERFFGPFGSDAWRGFAAYFDIALPFDRGDHPAMHGVLLLAVFGFCHGIGLAIAARKPLLASAALIAGACWPATIMSGPGDLTRGALVLGAALLLFAGLRAFPTHGVRQPVLAGLSVVLAALVLSSSPSVARGGFVDGWRDWDVQGKAEPSLSVKYVWDADYGGIRFPKKPSTVLKIAAPENAAISYWRATTLDVFTGDHWEEGLVGQALPENVDGYDDLSDDPFLPPAARDPGKWLRAVVEVEALRDIHLVAPSVPVAYDVDERDVAYHYGNIAVAAEGIDRGDSYTAYSYVPEPTARQLAESSAAYPDEPLFDRYLKLDQVQLPRFGTPGRDAVVRDVLAGDPRLAPYSRLYQTALNVVGRPRSPYAAVVALETWFRTGNFAYDEQPPAPRAGPPLVAFVRDTQRGYCQHFAGAMALMLRQLGIPARVAAGFTAGRYDRDDERWVVADRNAHTWVEVWFEEWGWLPFDPTPGRGRLTASYTSSSFSFDILGAGQILAESGGEASALLRAESRNEEQQRAEEDSAAGQAALRRGGDSQRSLTALLLLIGFGALALLVAAKLARRAVRFVTRDPRRVAAACRRDLVGFLADQGIAVPASATLVELARTVEQELAVDTKRLMQALMLARFGPDKGAPEAAGRARRELRRVRRALRARLSVPRRARGLVSLRSLAA